MSVSGRLRWLSSTSNFNPVAGKMKFTLVGRYAVYIGSYGRFKQAIGAIFRGQVVQVEA